MGILLLIGCGIITKQYLEKNKSVKEIFAGMFVEVGIAIGAEYVIKELKILRIFVGKILKKFLDLHLKEKLGWLIASGTGKDSSKNIIVIMVKYFFRLTNFISPNIEKEIRTISNFVYMEHSFATVIVIATCFEVLILNSMNTIWYRILKEKKALAIFVLVNVYTISSVWYDMIIGFGKLGKIVITAGDLCFIFIAIFLGKRKGYLLKEEEKDFVIQDVDDILQKILIVYGILALPLLG